MPHSHNIATTQRPNSRAQRLAFRRNLGKAYRWYTGAFVSFVLLLAGL